MSLKKLHELKTVKGKRLRIIRDALLQMKLKKIIVRQGTYHDLIGDDDQDARWNQYIGQWLKAAKGNKCEACALGSVLCGLTVSNGDFGQDSNTHEVLANYFDSDNLRLIETAFEGYVVEGYIENEEEEDRCYAFYDKYHNNTHKRLIAIFKNMLKNGGVFVP